MTGPKVCKKCYAPLEWVVTMPTAHYAIDMESGAIDMNRIGWYDGGSVEQAVQEGSLCCSQDPTHITGWTFHRSQHRIFPTKGIKGG